MKNASRGINVTSNVKNKKAAEYFRKLEAGGEISHAYLIEGEDMERSMDFARFAASLVLCEAKSGEKPCGKCGSCVKAANDNHPDITVFASAGGRSSFHISDIREIRSDAYVVANEGVGKVYILSDAQDMTAQAQNAMLKLLEEPPAGVKFFILARRREQLLPTVISRCQIVNLGSSEYDADIPDEAYDAMTKLLAISGTRFDFFSYFISLRPKRDAALILLSGMRNLAGQLLVLKTAKTKNDGTRDERTDKLLRLGSARFFAAASDELAEAISAAEGNANINALFTALAFALWSAKTEKA